MKKVDLYGANWRSDFEDVERFDDDMKASYLNRLVLHGIHDLAAKEAGVTVDIVDQALRDDMVFKRATDEANRLHESAMIRRVQDAAFNGLTSTRYHYKGIDETTGEEIWEPQYKSVEQSTKSLQLEAARLVGGYRGDFVDNSKNPHILVVPEIEGDPHDFVMKQIEKSQSTDDEAE